MDAEQASEVLVVGAGPVGLTVAHELLRRGVRVLIVDAAQGPATTSRALATHARTLEIYDQMGVLDEIERRGKRVHAFTRHRAGQPQTRYDWDFSDLPSRFEYSVFVDQVITEEVLRTAVAAHGVEVRWQTRLERFTQDADGVRATLRNPDGAEYDVRVPWLVGCDGGHSTVRAALDIHLQGESSETWLIADAVVHADLDTDAVHWLAGVGGSIMLFPHPDEGKWRLLDTAEATPGTGTEIAERFAAKVGAALQTPVRVEEPTWTSVFTIQQRAVPTMRSGRCFVAGDAAHVHSPASGQGMNTGIQDGFNLAWKLAAVVHGAEPSLVDTYSAERVPVGQALLSSTANVTDYIVNDDARKDDLGNLLGFGSTLIGGMSALAISYPQSQLNRTKGPVEAGPVPGERITGCHAADVTPAWEALFAALRHPGWIAVDGPDTEGAAPPYDARILRVTASPTGDPDELPDEGGTFRAALGLGAGDRILVRPDGYVAERTTAAVPAGH